MVTDEDGSGFVDGGPVGGGRWWEGVEEWWSGAVRCSHEREEKNQLTKFPLIFS